MKKLLLTVLCSLPILCLAQTNPSDTLEFQEAFAWGDRAKALQMLSPNTEDFYDYHCLAAQLRGDGEAFERVFSQWRTFSRNRLTPRMREMQRRQRLLRFAEEPEAAWEFLREDLGLTFDHRPRDARRDARAPSRIAAGQYTLEAFLAEARRRSFPEQVSDRGIEFALKQELSPDQRRALLGRLDRADIPGLVELVADDLEYRNSRGFGSLAVHRLLSRDQLEALGRRRPSLLREEAYVLERLARIPAPEIDFQYEHAAAAEYFSALWDFAGGLEAMHNSLKAGILYQLLDHRRCLGQYDEALFRAYLELPRPVPYLPAARRNALRGQQAQWVDFNYRGKDGLRLPPIGDEEPLVRAYLLERLRDAPNAEAYARYFEADWLKAVFAESKILHGAGRPEDWAADLSPERYRRILDRVELDFAASNPSRFRPGDAVELAVDLKRIDRLRIKIYRIQTFNYYTSRRRPVEQTIDLDGMTATYERTLETRAAPGRRMRRRLQFPELSERGVYVIELIGGGVSSRALVRIGALEAISQITPRGLAVMVLDEQGARADDPGLWLEGREFSPGKDGVILLPFSENPGSRFVVLRSGDFHSPETLDLPGENYAFRAGIHLDPQNLPRRETGTLVLRPDLRINHLPVSPERLDEVWVTLAAIDARGVRTERRYPAEFERHAEWTRSFHVPDDLRRLEVRVEGVVTRISDNENQGLSDRFALDINTARAGDTLRQALLVSAAEGRHLELRGLNGEPIAAAPLRVILSHPAFRCDLRFSVTTDDRGQVALGTLDGIAAIAVAAEDGTPMLSQSLSAGEAVLPGRIQGRAGEPISLPYPLAPTPGLAAVSLTRMERGRVQAHLAEKALVGDGELRIDGLAEGEYELRLHETGQRVNLVIARGERRFGYIFGERTRLQETGTRRPSLAAVERVGDRLRLTLRHPTSSTRVAIRAARYEGPGGSLPPGLGFVPPAARLRFPPFSQYVSGRNIGDEYRYVLERQGREIFAGSLLQRPGLILNRWMRRETSAERERLKVGEAYRSRDRAPRREEALLGDAFAKRPLPEEAAGVPEETLPHLGYDFLPAGSAWRVNLRPDANGVIELPSEALGEAPMLDILVLDRFGTSRTRHLRPDRGIEPREVRLARGLDPDGAFSRQKTIQALAAGDTAVFPDLATTRYQPIATLGQAFDLLHALGGPAGLDDFKFLKTWPDLDEAAKRERYGEFACHELHLFLRERDPEFFEKVVRPYLENKHHKTFVDRWLLEALEPEDTRLDRLDRRNALELALLARRGGDRETVLRAMDEELEIAPPAPEEFARQVRTALQFADLDEAVAAARAEARQNAAGESRILEKSLAEESLGRSERGSRHTVAQALAVPSPAKPAAPAPAAPELSFGLKEATLEETEAAESVADAYGDRGVLPPELYRALPKTKEWAEQNYYKLTPAEDTPDRIPVRAYWRDVAAGVAPSEHLLEAHGSLGEILAALAFCGLPFAAESPEETHEGAGVRLEAAAPCLLVGEQIRPAEPADEARPLLLSQQFFRPDDRYRYEGRERIEKFVAGEFLRRVVYGGRIILTNPTASRRRLNLLLQIPVGAIPLCNGFYTDDRAVVLEPYATETVEYFFYFPAAGDFGQFPAQAAEREKIVGRADPRRFRVVDAPTEIDRTSWAWVAQHATAPEVLEFLREHNLRRLDLDEMAWRLRDPEFFAAAWDLLAGRLHVHETTRSYALFHRDVDRARVYLAASRLAEGVGPVLDSPLLRVDPVERKTYEHLEYAPLVNPRAHPVGERRKILNTALDAQYRAFLKTAMYRDRLGPSGRLALAGYLLLQDRLGEAREQLATVRGAETASRLQLDAMRAWLALRELDFEEARKRAAKWREHPVPRWRTLFADIERTIAEAEGAGAEEAGAEGDADRQRRLDRAAERAPGIELSEEDGRLRLVTHNLERVEMNLYPIDIERLFSRRPFPGADEAGFTIVQPAYREEIPAGPDGEAVELKLPEAFADRNLVVEVAARGIRRVVTRQANRLRVRMMPDFGQVEVRGASDGRPLPRVYVKVYARGLDGRVTFWKDGYTDPRGRFDYLSLNDRKPEEAVRFSMLVLDPERGAVIREAGPPAR